MGDQRRKVSGAEAPPTSPPDAHDAALLTQGERALLDMARRLTMYPHHADACATARAVAERMRLRASAVPVPKSSLPDDE